MARLRRRQLGSGGGGGIQNNMTQSMMNRGRTGSATGIGLGAGYSGNRIGSGAPSGFASDLTPEQLASMQRAGEGGLNYRALGQMQGMATQDQAAARFGAEQARVEEWGIDRFMDARGRFGFADDGTMEAAMARASSQSERGVVTDELMDKMFQRQAGVIEGETQRGQAQIMEGLSNRGLAGSGQGLGSIAGMAGNRMRAKTNAKRDVDIWGELENLKGKERANASLNQLMALRADIAGRRSDLDMSFRLGATDYSGFTTTPTKGLGFRPTVVGFTGGEGGGDPGTSGITEKNRGVPMTRPPGDINGIGGNQAGQLKQPVVQHKETQDFTGMSFDDNPSGFDYSLQGSL